MKKIEIKGHSGCSVDIVNKNGELFIEKATQDKSYSARLALQAEKQRKAFAKEYQYIRIPQIFDVEKTDESLSILMEYVYSKNFVEQFEISGFDQIHYFIKALCYFIDDEIESSEMQDVSVSVFSEKFDSVKKKVFDNDLLNKNDRCVSIMNDSEKLFNAIKQIKIPVGICHGDLTFSNILFNGNNYYLIDFLDSFIESPLMDIVKIRQDSKYMWSYLMYDKPFDKIRLRLICEKIDVGIDTHFKKYSWYSEYYKAFQVMNFLRVLQYAHEENVTDYLLNTLEDMLHE